MNCNNFSNEVTTFLTGRPIPQDILEYVVAIFRLQVVRHEAHISVPSLPKEFLSTPLGASLRPMIDNMFRGGPPDSGHPNGALPNGLGNALNGVASSAYGNGNGESGSGFANSSAAAESVGSPLSVCTNPASFASLLKTHRCLAVNFTNERGCQPCRQIAPTFEKLARESTVPDPIRGESSGGFGRPRKGRDIAFVKVDTTMSGQLAAQFEIRATPTFKFFLDGKEVSLTLYNYWSILSDHLQCIRSEKPRAQILPS